MRLEESRRITGPHLLLAAPGAGAEVWLEPGEDWSAPWARVRAAVEALGWPWRPGVRTWPGGVSLAFEAPEDQLETAAWVFDHAFEGAPPLAQLQADAAREAKPALLAFLAAVRARGLPVFWDEDRVTVGLGQHARTWSIDALPDPHTVEGGRVPLCFVTGTNGKTTTTRLVARMAQEAGYITGNTSSDGVVVAGETVKKGDWTGPGAARQVLRDDRVGFAVLETARGGLMRRGLAITGADAAIVTNVSDDHLGEWGIVDLAGTAEAKLVIARGLRPGGVLVANAGSAPLAAAAAPLGPVWFGYDPGPERAAWHEDGWLMLDGAPLLRVEEIPITFGGAARFNVENALGAALLARVMGIDRAAIVRALRAFRPTPEDNAGRMNVVDLGGVTAVVDFAHNPDGIRQIGPVIQALPARRRVIVLGQAGDRRDEDVAALVDEVVRVGFDHVVLKELPEHRRGRAVGEVPAMLRSLLLARGFPASEIDEEPDELPAVERALAWAEAGDLVLLLVHEHYDAVMERLRGAT